LEVGLEEWRQTGENIGQTAATQTQSRSIAPRGLDGMREAARKDKHVRFTALLDHVTVDLLWANYYELLQQAASGVVGVMWHPYGTGVEPHLGDLHGGASGGLLGATVEATLYSQSGRTAARFEDSQSGGKDCLTGTGQDPELYL